MKQCVRRRRGQVTQVAVPGVGKVELIPWLLDDPDDIGTVLERSHIRGGVPATKQVGDPFEVVEVDVLLRQENHQVIGECLADVVQLFAFGYPAQVNAADGGAERTS